METCISGLLALCLILLTRRSAGQRGRECITASGGPGTCMAVSECQQIRNLTSLIQAGIAPPGSRELLRNSICSVRRRELLVCCSGLLIPVQPTIDQPATVQPTTDQLTAVQPIPAQPTRDQSIIFQPNTDQTTIFQPTNDQSIIFQPTTDQTSTVQSTADNPDTVQPSPVQPISAQTTTAQPENVSKESPLPENCGIQAPRNKTGRGGEAPLRAWPWMVLFRGKVDEESIWYCQGTLISSRYVLSAAQCFNPLSGFILEYARIGEHNLATLRDCDDLGCAPTPQDITVKRVISHPEYGHGCTNCNDIALVELSQDADIDLQYVAPICLPVNPVRDMGFSAQFFQGKIGSVAGWGSTSTDPGERQFPDILVEGDIPIQDKPHCQILKSSYLNKDSVICAGGDGQAACKGDAGGPLTLTNDKATKHFLIGTVSIGANPCGSEGTQGLYTSVHHYVPWILSVLQSES